jgi:hypothetical protein
MARSLTAAVMPIETWSSLPPEVGRLSVVAGWASTFISFRSATATTCAIIMPEDVPGWVVKNGGSPSFMSGLTSRSVRRSLMLPSEQSAMAA